MEAGEVVTVAAQRGKPVLGVAVPVRNTWYDMAEMRTNHDVRRYLEDEERWELVGEGTIRGEPYTQHKAPRKPNRVTIGGYDDDEVTLDALDNVMRQVREARR